MAPHDPHHQQQHEPRHQQQQQEQQQQQHYQEHQEHHTPEKKEKGNKKKDQKPELHQKKEWKGVIHYESGSDSFSDNSSLYTNETPNTEYSGHSSHHYYKDKKHDFKRRPSHRDSRSHDHDDSPVQQVFRERRRKSPARSTHSGQEYEVVETIISSGDYDRPHDRMYTKDRSGHQRTSSYNDSRSSRPVYGHKRLNSYAHPVRNDHDEEKERLQYEIAAMQRQRSEERRDRARLESDRLERQKLEVERERLQSQKERDRLERVRLENERYQREKSERERYDRHDRRRLDDSPERPYRERRPINETRYRERERPRRILTDHDVRMEDLYYH